MIIRVKRPSDVPSSEITPEDLYVNRRRFIKQAAFGAAGLALAPSALAAMERPPHSGPIQQVDYSKLKSELGEPVNSYEDITHYNNFYEFGTSKDDPAANSGAFHPRPWTVAVEGHVKNPGNYHLEDFLAPYKLEDRVYRMRCVEAWSIVVPWRGFPLADLVKRAEPTGEAKFVEFTTIMRPSEMPGERGDVLPWPYLEGLRLDEAMNPLTLMVTGLYGKDLPNQDGAPLRLIVPWKYGFKGIKSIVRIRFVGDMPHNTWWVTDPHEYGFYANVNPHVDHPRWSQASERRLGEWRRRKTLMFNGYADQVASMYAGMDLRRWF
jgi:methionine sulfoxide reductase catalytic subunit